ncbi:MAG: hypothetical protein ACLVAT_07570 [Lachnospiraceae bacterium]
MKTRTEATSVLDQLADNFATLGIPLMLIDRSADEESDLGKSRVAEGIRCMSSDAATRPINYYNKAVKAKCKTSKCQ